MGVKWLIVNLREDENLADNWSDFSITPPPSSYPRHLQSVLDLWGIKHHTVNFKDILVESPLPLGFGPNDEVFVFGPINSVRQLSERFGWLNWMPLNLLRCTSYYPYFSPWLFQQDRFYLPALELLQRWDHICEFLNEDVLFVRPDTNSKIFTGDVFGKEEYQSIYQGSMEPTTMLVVARPQKVTREWRVLMVNGKIITGSLYKKDGDLCHQEDLPPDESWIRRCWSQGYSLYPGPKMIHMDIAEDQNGNLGLLELSSVNSAGIYGMDVEKFVGAIQDFAQREYYRNAIPEEVW